MLTRRATLAGLAALGLPLAAKAEGFPTRTITIIVPYPPGGPIDALARLIAQEGAGDLNASIVVETAPAGRASSAPARWQGPSPMVVRSCSAPTRPTPPTRA
jgi:tripartite-type tricarboxylate transporter receptor subunit TctC